MHDRLWRETECVQRRRRPDGIVDVICRRQIDVHSVFPPADRHGDVARVHTEVLHRRDGDLRLLTVIAALRAAERAEMAVRAVVIDILCLAVDAVRRVGDLRHVVAAERHVHAEAHDRIRHLCRDGGNKRTVGIDA